MRNNERIAKRKVHFKKGLSNPIGEITYQQLKNTGETSRRKKKQTYHREGDRRKLSNSRLESIN